MELINFEDTKVIDENGYLTPGWKEILSQLIGQLQKNYSQEGLFVPPQTDTNITKLDNVKSNRALIYDETNDKLLININGTFKEIQTI